MQRTCCSLYTRAARWAAAAYDCMPMCIGSFSYTRSRLASLARFLFVGQSDVRLRSLLQGTRVTYVTETFPENRERDAAFLCNALGIPVCVPFWKKKIGWRVPQVPFYSRSHSFAYVIGFHLPMSSALLFFLSCFRHRSRWRHSQITL